MAWKSRAAGSCGQALVVAQQVNRKSSTPSSGTSSGSGCGRSRELGVVRVQRDLLELVPGDGAAGPWQLGRTPPRPATVIGASLPPCVQ